VYDELGAKKEAPAWNKNAEFRPRRIAGLVHDNAELESARVALETEIHLRKEEVLVWRSRAWELRTFMNRCAALPTCKIGMAGISRRFAVTVVLCSQVSRGVVIAFKSTG